MLVLVSGVVTQRDCVVGSRAQVAHDPPLHARTLARSSCLGIPRALMAHPHHVRAIRGHTAPGGHAYMYTMEALPSHRGRGDLHSLGVPFRDSSYSSHRNKVRPWDIRCR